MTCNINIDHLLNKHDTKRKFEAIGPVLKWGFGLWNSRYCCWYSPLICVYTTWLLGSTLYFYFKHLKGFFFTRYQYDSFWNEFILSLHTCISLYLFRWYQNNISFPYESFWNEFIPKIVYSGESGVSVSDLVWKPSKWEHLTG